MQQNGTEEETNKFILVKYWVPMLKVPRVESDHILIGPDRKNRN